MSAGECQTKNVKEYNEEDEKPIIALDEGMYTVTSDLTLFYS